jgi:DNA relaxase NicK
LKAYISPHWLKFTLPKEFTNEELNGICTELFGHSFSKFERIFKPRDYYRDCNTFHELVSVYRSGWMKNKGSTCFDISGTGLDTLGLDISKLGKYALDKGGNICRIDLAAQDTNNHVPYEAMVNSCLTANFKDRVKTRFNRGIGKAPKIEIQPIRRIVFGSEKSDNYLVVYDRQQTEDLDFPWLCFEQRIQNREDCAEIIRTLIDGKDAGEYYAGLLRGKLDFLQAAPGKKEGKAVELWWSSFLGDVARCKIKRLPKSKNPWRSQREKGTDVGKALRHIRRLEERQDADGLQQIMFHAGVSHRIASGF